MIGEAIYWIVVVLYLALIGLAFIPLAVIGGIYAISEYLYNKVRRRHDDRLSGSGKGV